MPSADVARICQIQTALWHPDSWFRKLPPGAQRLYLYLTTNADRTVTGTQPLRPRKWAQAAAGLTEAQVLADLDDLVQAGRAIVDLDTEEVMLRWYMRDTGVTANDNWMKAVPDAQAAVESPVIRKAITEERAAAQTPSAADQGSLFPTPGAGGREGVPKGAARGPQAPVEGDNTQHPTPNTQHLIEKGTRARATAGTRLPDGWRPDAELRAWAAKTVPDVDARRETAKFVDYWRATPGARGVKRDWPATWRNWMRRADEPRQHGGSNGSGPSERGSW